MNTNLLIALKNIIQKPVVNLVAYYKGSNRINNVGEALEIYIKDVFCNSLEVEDLNQKLEIY